MAHKVCPVLLAGLIGLEDPEIDTELAARCIGQKCVMWLDEDKKCAMVSAARMLESIEWKKVYQE